MSTILRGQRPDAAGDEVHHRGGGTTRHGRAAAGQQAGRCGRLLRPHYARGADEAHAPLREAFTLPGDPQIIGGTLHVRLDPATAPRRSRALAALCEQLNDTQTRYPGTDLTLHYPIKDQPGLT